MKRAVIIFVFLVSKIVFAQNLNAKDFVIDKSKPYVYLEFEHIGPRTPIQSGEPGTGLWLRVVNNCRLPIAFRSSGWGLFDEVVANKQGLQIYSDKDWFDVETKEKDRQLRLKQMPEGYSGEVGSIATVQPGERLLFNVPLNHVDEYWHLTVRFALVLDKSSSSLGPFTYLPFYDFDIPREQRPVKTHN